MRGKARRQVEHEVRTRGVEISELLQERRAVVLGDPGTGKTTLLRYLAYSLAQGQIANFQPEIIGRTPELAYCLPVYIRIGEYAQHLQANSQAPLDAFAPLSCQARQLPLSDTLLNEAMGQGRVLFLLDGLDEIIETGQRREIAQRIEEFARGHSQCRMIVTSRIVGYREVQLGGAFVQFTISPFADQDIRRFAEKWYAPLEVSDDAKQLVQAIQENPSVRRLAANPLLLTVIALIHWRGAKLPHHRVTLYRVAAETLVDQWMSYRRVSPEGWDVHETLQVLLPATAWHLHSTTSSGLIGEQELHNLLVETLQQHDPRLSENAAHSHASQFRRNVSEFSGIFLERGLDQDGRGLYGFLHLTFEEYFTAVHLADQWERGGKSVLKPLLHDPRWSESILLTAGLLSESSQYRATQFVKTILSARSEYENILHRDLLMAARCLADDVRVDAEVRRAISGKLLKLYFDFKLPDALQEDIGQIFTRFGGTAVEKDVLGAVFERLAAPKMDMRVAAARALGQLGAAAAKPEEVVAILLEVLANPEGDVYWMAAWTLGELGKVAARPEVLSTLLKLLATPRREVSRAVGWALGKLGQIVTTPEVLSTLLRLMTDSKGAVCWAAAEAVRQMGPAAATPEVLSALLKCLAGSDLSVRGAAAIALGGLGQAAATPEILSTLLKLLTDPEGDIRRAAAVALGGLGSTAATPEILSTLLKLLTDSHWSARRAAAVALGRLEPAAVTPEILSTLLKLLTDSGGDIRQAAAWAVGGLGQAAATPKTLSTLLMLLADPDGDVRHAAAEAMGQMGQVAATPDTLPALLKLLTDPEGEVRGAAAEALGQMGQAAATLEIIRALLELLTGNTFPSSRKFPHGLLKEYVRGAAAGALRNLSAYVHSQERPEVMKLFLPLARSRAADSREMGYVGLRNLLAGDHGEAAQT